VRTYEYRFDSERTPTRYTYSGDNLLYSEVLRLNKPFPVLDKNFGGPAASSAHVLAGTTDECSRSASLQRFACRAGVGAFVGVSCVSLVFVVAWAVLTLRTRLLDGVEGEIIFEAMRLRQKAALYIDPVLGDSASGDPATRFFVLYPPVFPWLVSLFEVSRIVSATTLVRALSMLAWTSAVLVLARSWPGAAPRSVFRRALIGGSAAFVLGAYPLSVYGMSGRPDAVALLLAALALRRAVGKGGLDEVSGVLFALAVFVKPNVLGLAGGATVATVLRYRGASWRGVGSLVGASVGLGGLLHGLSGGQFVHHLAASTMQDTSLQLWLSQMSSRLPFFLAPVALSLVVAARNLRDKSIFVAFSALAVSLCWALVSLSKIGSASNYWMEPCLGALAVCSRVGDFRLSSRSSTVAAVLLGLQAPYVGVASIRSSLEGIAVATAQRAAVERVRALCNIFEGAVILADEPGLELELGGRVVDTAFQFAHTKNAELTRAWERSFESPRVGCVVSQQELKTVDVPIHDRFPARVRAAIRRRFELIDTIAGLYIYRAR